MNHAHLELLSHEDIDRDVERVYRAYCDAKLLEYAKKSGTPAEYWAQVVTFRRANFGPLDRSEFVERAPKEMPVSPEQQRKLWADEGQKYTGRLEFLYWFDVRADFWSTVDKKKFDKEVVVTPEQLEMLHGAIQAARRRLHEAKALEARDGNWRCRDRNDEILESLPRSWPGVEAVSSRPSRE